MDETDYLKNINYKPEGRRIIGRPKLHGGMISGRKEQTKGSKPYSWLWCKVWVVVVVIVILVVVVVVV